MNMEIFDVIGYLVAFLLLLAAAFNVATKWVSLLGLGLAVWVLVYLVHAIQALD